MFSHLKEDIECVFDRDPAARTFFEVLTTYPGVHAVLIHRLSHKLWSAFFYRPRHGCRDRRNGGNW